VRKDDQAVCTPLAHCLCLVRTIQEGDDTTTLGVVLLRSVLHGPTLHCATSMLCTGRVYGTPLMY
jgi:hypothetical protein